MKLILTLLFLTGAAASFAQRTITVMGDGKASAKPDYAVVTFTNSVQDNSVQSAFAKTDEFLSRLKKSLGAVGVQAEDIEVRGFVLNPTYDYSINTGSSPRLIGYNYISSYSFKVRDLASLPKALDAAGNTGAMNLAVESFNSSRSAALGETALKEAIAEAREKAARLAKEMNAVLGEILSITDGEAIESSGGGGGSEYEREEKERRSAMFGAGSSQSVTKKKEVRVVFSVK
jgi:uncharacterized protein YggE